MTPRPQPQPSAAVAAGGSGPVGLLLGLVVGTAAATLFSWLLSIAIELAGMQFEWMWKDQGVLHSRDMVIEDLGYIADAPKSVLISDTVAFAHRLMEWVALPFVHLGVPEFYAQSLRKQAEQAQQPLAAGGSGRTQGAMRRVAANANVELAKLGVVALYTAQETVLRLAIVVFAIPAFVLACLMGAVDGLVRRDLRKWGGGRESSFVYHHAKATTWLALGGGFSVYLAWPVGGFNPAYLVLTFTLLVAWSLSMTLASFKKYL